MDSTVRECRAAPLLPAANNTAYLSGRRVPSCLHALWAASFYGGFGFLSVTRQLWLLTAVFDVFTGPLGLESVSGLLMPPAAQEMMQLMGFPFVALGLYYIRHRYDAAFMLTSVYGRLVAGGVGVLYMIHLGKLPTGCWLVWVCDVFPSIICYLDLRRCRINRNRCGLSPFHGFYGAFFYGGLGVLGVSHNLELLIRLAPRTFDFHMMGHSDAQHVMRLAGLPFIALGLYFIIHRKDPDFLLSTVYARLVGGPGGAIFCLCIFRHLPGAIMLLALGELPAALYCLWDLKMTGTKNFRSVQPKKKGRAKKPPTM